MTSQSNVVQIPFAEAAAPQTANLQTGPQPFQTAAKDIPNVAPPIGWQRSLQMISASLIGFAGPFPTSSPIAREIRVVNAALFKLKFGATTVGPIRADSPAKLIEEFIHGFPGFTAATVTVTGEVGGPWTIVTKGALGNAASAGITVVEITPGTEGEAYGENSTVSAMPLPPDTLDVEWVLVRGGTQIFSLTLTMNQIFRPPAAPFYAFYQGNIEADFVNPIGLELGSSLAWRCNGYLPKQEGKVGGMTVAFFTSARLSEVGPENEGAGAEAAGDSTISYTDER